MAIPRRREPGADLPLELVDFLLGVERSSAEIERLEASGIPYDAFSTFDYERLHHEKIKALRRQHSDYLRAEAQRRGISFPRAKGDDE